VLVLALIVLAVYLGIIIEIVVTGGLSAS